MKSIIYQGGTVDDPRPATSLGALNEVARPEDAAREPLSLKAILPPRLAVPGREELLGEIQLLRQANLAENEIFLLVINLADTKKYDDIIRIFGYKFADDLVGVRIADIRGLTLRTTIYHIGFWSIALIFHGTKRENFTIFLGKLAACLAVPIICRGIPVPIKAGIGVCDLKLGLGSDEDLLQSAFLAGQTSSKSVKSWEVCNYNLSADHRRAFTIIGDAAPALTELNEFELGYQPRIDLKTNRIVAAEALLRWNHPALGLISPDEFIPLLEMTGLMRQVTDWVLENAIVQTIAWHDAGMYLKICVNISVKNLEEEDFTGRVGGLLAYHGLDPKYLELELSEASPFFDFDNARARLVALRRKGIGIAVDDFGTGDDSFGFLKTVPANIMKIDQSLIHTVDDNSRNRAVVKAMIAMAHDVDMAVVAEGVESGEIFTLLQSWGCDYAQGFHICDPLSAEAFAAWCAAQPGRVARVAIAP